MSITIITSFVKNRLNNCIRIRVFNPNWYWKVILEYKSSASLYIWPIFWSIFYSSIFKSCLWMHRSRISILKNIAIVDSIKLIHISCISSNIIKTEIESHSGWSFLASTSFKRFPIYCTFVITRDKVVPISTMSACRKFSEQIQFSVSLPCYQIKGVNKSCKLLRAIVSNKQGIINELIFKSTTKTRISTTTIVQGEAMEEL